MRRFINTLKAAYVGFCEELKLNYAVKFSDGRQYSRKVIKMKVTFNGRN